MPESLAFLVEWHAEDAAILWCQRQLAAAATHFRLSDLEHHDQRLDAHLDGLLVHGHEGWAAAQRGLVWEEGGEVFTAAAVALLSDVQRLQNVLEVVVRQPALEAALVDALGWVPDEISSPVAERLAGSHEPLEKRLGLAAQVQLRRASSQQLLAAAEFPCEPLQAIALHGLGTQGVVAANSYLRTYLAEERESLRLAAAWSLVRISCDGQACDLLREYATSSDTPEAAEIVPWVMACQPLPAGAAWIEQLSQQPGTFDRAVFAAGALGAPDLLDWLLDCMTAPAWARQAGEAFTEITGLDILQQDLDAPPPDRFEAGPTDDPADDDVAPDPYERYPWPDSVRLAQWWNRHRSQFSLGQRYFLGRPAAETVWLQHVLRYGTQRQRIAAARALAFAFPAQPVFPAGLHARRQYGLLAKWLAGQEG